MSEQNTRPPRDTVIRARTDLTFRAADSADEDLGQGYLGLLKIRFSPVNEWTEVDSMWEGHFMERFAPGAWKKTIRERASKIRSLFQHGRDPQVGDKPIGPFHRLEEDDEGGYAEVKMLDTSYNRDLVPGLKEGLYGASHRFGVMRAKEDKNPEPSEHNPHGIKEVTVTEARLHELGPVTFPQYEGATAGMRSLTDEFLISCFQSDPERLREMFERAAELSKATARAVDHPSDCAGCDDVACPHFHNVEPGCCARHDEANRSTAPSKEPDAAPSRTSAQERRDPVKGRYGLSQDDQRPSWVL